MGWKNDYKSRLVALEEALQGVRDGDRVVIPLTEQPLDLISQLMKEASRLSNVSICVSTPAFDMSLLIEQGVDVEVEVFLGPLARQYENEGIAPFLPLPFSMTFKANDERPQEAKSIDVCLVSVTPPNDEGMVSFGPQPWFKMGYSKRATTVIAEVNPNLIRTYGDCFMHVDEFDFFVEKDFVIHTTETLLTLVSGYGEPRRSALEEIIRSVSSERLAPLASRFENIDIQVLRTMFGLDDASDQIKSIANHVEALIPHGACIQIGVGSPSSYLPRLGIFDNKIDLGLHTELTVPGIARLVEARVINGSQKNVHENKAVAVSWSGSDDRDLKIIDGNRNFELYEPDYLLNPSLISSNDQQVAINNALTVDLTGQICSESIFGGKMINGIGGQPETHVGALYSKGGRAITLLQSTAMSGSISRIVPKLNEGELVTIPRYWADTIVTEYGVANLLGKNHRERAEQLIGIAHPDFREDLSKSLKGWLIP